MFLYFLTGNLGLSIILLTVLIKAILVPATNPQLRTMKKQQALKPELDKIKKKYKDDKKKQAEAQMTLFKEHGLNPGSGCITMFATIVVMLALYTVIRKIALATDIDQINQTLYFEALKVTEGIKTSFLWFDLSKPDPFYVLAVVSGIVQFIVSKMTMSFNKSGEAAAKETPDRKDDIAYNIQQQMLYTMPIFNVVIGISLPAGVVLYLVVSTVFSAFQTYFVLREDISTMPVLKKEKK